ncbi:unnamed protein product [Symbiodinium sp. CCMP2592]|nr:unnamed protein product [Symbiodinium sp. CCMP2592]
MLQSLAAYEANDGGHGLQLLQFARPSDEVEAQLADCSRRFVGDAMPSGVVPTHPELGDSPRSAVTAARDEFLVVDAGSCHMVLIKPDVSTASTSQSLLRNDITVYAMPPRTRPLLLHLCLSPSCGLSGDQPRARRQLLKNVRRLRMERTRVSNDARELAL